MITKEQYETYLLGEHWREFSRTVCKQRMVCEKCGMDQSTSKKKYRQNLNVHHKTYKNLGNEKPEDVELLCYACHLEKHGNRGWIELVESYAMPEPPKFAVNCSHCGKDLGFTVWNFDELGTPRLCSECRDGAISYDY